MIFRRQYGRRALAAAVALFATAGLLLAQQDEAERKPASSVKTDRAEPLPGELEGVGLTEKLGDSIPLDLKFTDSNGNPVTLKKYFDQGRPVILNLGYFGCPMLCGVIMNGMLEAMQETPMMPGEDYEVLTISFDPSEAPVLARLKKQNYIKEFGNPQAASGWHFLVGKQDAISRLTDSVGYEFKWNERRGEFAHPSALVILTPEGRISRYLYGVRFPSTTFRLSLVEASEGKIGSTLDQLILYCFHYDDGVGQYTPAAINIMRLGGGITAIVLISLIGAALIREMRRRRSRRAETPGTDDA
jgi:protein SCO1/2